MDEVLHHREQALIKREHEERVIEEERMTRDVNRLRLLEEQEEIHRHAYETFLQKIQMRSRDLDGKEVQGNTYLSREFDRLRLVQGEINAKIHKVQQEEQLATEHERLIIVAEADAIEALKEVEARERVLCMREQNLDDRQQACAQREADDRVLEMKIADKIRSNQQAAESADRELEILWRQLEEMITQSDEALSEEAIRLKRRQRDVDEKRNALQLEEQRLQEWEARLDDRERDITRREHRTKDFDRRIIERMKRELEERHANLLLADEQLK